MEYRIGDFAHRRIHEYIHAFAEYTHVLGEPLFEDTKSDCMAMRRTLIRAACPRWRLMRRSSGPISVLETQGNLIALCLNASRSHAARALPVIWRAFPS